MSNGTNTSTPQEMAALETLDAKEAYIINGLKHQYIKWVAQQQACQLFNMTPMTYEVMLDYWFRKWYWEDRIIALFNNSENIFWEWVHGACPSYIDKLLKRISCFPEDVNLTKSSSPAQALIDSFSDPKDAHAAECLVNALKWEETTGYEMVIQAALESRTQLEVLREAFRQLNNSESPVSGLWTNIELDYPNIKSGFRNRSTQLGLYARKDKDVSNAKAQQIRMRSSSAPMTSRHHWGSDYDLYDIGESGANGNHKFRIGQCYGCEFSLLTAIARFVGFSQPYTHGRYLGYTRGKITDSLRLEKFLWWRVEEKENPLTTLPVQEAITQYHDSSDVSLYGNIGGYLEECWHWSYFPIAQALQDFLQTPERILESHRRMTEYWESETTKKIGFEYPRKMWTDHVFHIHDMSEDYLFVYGAGTFSDEDLELPPLE
jgi:hypothetical protein